MADMEARVQRSLQEVKKVLDATRSPRLATEVHHEYTDKFLLAEFVTGAACAGQLLCLEALGLTAEGLAKLAEVGRKRTVTLSLRSVETCAFEKKTTREVEDATKHVTEVAGLTGTTKITDKVVRTVTEYFWNVGVSYELFAYAGNDKDGADRVVLCSGERKTQIKTLCEDEPSPKRHVHEGMETDLSWLVKHVELEGLRVGFQVDRLAKKCHTPRRNADVEEALQCLGAVGQFGTRVATYFQGRVFAVEQDHGLDTASLNAVDVFVPVLPLLEVREHGAETGAVVQVSDLVKVSSPDVPANGTVMLAGDMNALLGGERKSLEERLARMGTTLGGGKGLITPAEGRVVVVGKHMSEVAVAHRQAVDFIEHMLRKQLVQAIGKEVSSADFTAYMQFHMRKVMHEAYTPRLFSHAVRRGEHNPEGVVALEQEVGGDMAEPVVTVGRELAAAEVVPMRFALNASSDVHFGGTRHVHSYVCHRFSTEAMPRLSLVGRARQFSGFVMMVGAIGGADLFLPQHAMIVQNKDDLKLPLLLEEIPTPKEFKDAIESLSPEQQRFAKAYRAMQLEATLFGVCVVQIKPQLERVLNLPPDSLTKEIRLTQDLLELFLEFQIPSDLVSYQCDSFEDEADVAASVKVEAVRTHVAAMREMVQKVKDDELAEAQQKREMEKARLEAEQAAMRQHHQQQQQQQLQMQQMMCQKQVPQFHQARGGGGPFAGAAMGGMASQSSAPWGGGGGGFAVNPTPMAFGAAQPSAAFGMPQGSAAAFGGFGAAAAPNPFCPPGAMQQADKAHEPAKKPDQLQQVAESTAADGVYDISALPQVLEKRYEALDEESCLRPTILKTQGAWRKRFQKTLLSKEETTTLAKDAQKKEKDRAFDLLDALTRSGALSVEDAALHVVVAATHCFDKTLMDTLVQDNVNPIEKVERSALIAASAVHNLAVASLLRGDNAARVKEHSPKLFLE